MRVLLAGLWSRRGLNGASLLIAVLAVAAAVLGPMYGRASAEHLLDTRIAQRPTYNTGLSFSVPALTQPQLPKGSPDNYRPPAPSALLDEASAPLESSLIDASWQPERSWLRDNGGSLTHGSRVFTTPLYWRDGMCRLARVRGRCPAKAGEVLVQATMAKALGAGVGDTIDLGYQDHFLRKVGLSQVEATRDRTRTFHVVGTYRITDPESADWYDSSRFTGIANLKPAGANLKQAGENPTTPALLVAPGSMTSQSFIAGQDRPIDSGAVNLDTMGGTERAVEQFRSKVLDMNESLQLADNDIPLLFHDVRAERSLLSRVLLAALAPFLVLALLLLYGLVASAAEVRRPYVALAKLRGHSSGQVFRFALAEPFLVVLLATPVGVAIAVLGTHLIARASLTRGIPVVLDEVAALSVTAVVLASLVASAAAAFAVIREPLAGALSSSVRPRPSSRWSVVLKSAVVAVAVASVAQLLTSGRDAGQLLGLVAPLFIALAIAVLGVFLLTVAGRWWVRRTRDRTGTASYLASRRLARRGDLTRLLIPLLLAVSVIAFAASTSITSDDWRVSRANAEVGAARTYAAQSSPERLLQVTRKVDQRGQYLAAAVVDRSGDDMDRRILLDTTRMASVAAWDSSWSDVPVSTLQRELEPHSRGRISFTGRSITVKLRDVLLRSKDTGPTSLTVQYLNDHGEPEVARLGNLRNGAQNSLRTSLSYCVRRCVLQQIYLSGEGASVSDAQGRLTIAGVAIDGKAVDWRLGQAGAWRPARPFPVSLVDPPVTLKASQSGLTVKVYLKELPLRNGNQPTMLSGIARLTPSTTPDVVPALVTTATKSQGLPVGTSGLALDYGNGVVAGTGLNGEKVPMRVVARVHALPVVGAQGELADLETSLVESGPPVGALMDVRLWAAPDTPPAMIAAVRRAGVPLIAGPTRDGILHDLRSDAFSVGLRIFLIVGLATLLLAIFGVLASAVTSSRWRSYEVASLRVVGVRQRSLLRASMLEYVVMLGFAVLLGTASAFLALTLVLPSVSLGNAADFDPTPVYSVHWPVVGGVAGGVFVLAVAIALLVSRRITRLGKPSTLRWAEQG